MKIKKLVILIFSILILGLGIFSLLKVHYDNKVYSVIDTYKVDYPIVKNIGLGLIEVSDGKKYGFIDKTGKIVIDLKYDYKQYYNPYMAGNYIVIDSKSKKTLIDRTGKELLNNYDQIYDSYDNGASYIIATNEGSADIYDNKLNKIFTSKKTNTTFINNNLILEYLTDFTNVYDMNGKKIFSGQYIENNNDFMATVKDKKFSIYLLKEGKYIPFASDSFSYNDSTILLKINGKYKLYDNEGNLIKTLPNKDKELYILNKSYLINFKEYMGETESGKLYDLNGNIIVSGFDELVGYKNNKFIVKQGKKCIYYLNNKKYKTFNKCEYAYFTSKKYIYVKYSKGSKLYDYNGNDIKKNYDYIESFNNKYIVKYAADLYSVTNDNLDVISDEYYTDYKKYNGGVVLKNAEGKYGILDNSLNKLSDYKYNDCDVSKNVIICEYNNSYEINTVSYMSKKDLKNYKKHVVKYNNDTNVDVEKVIKDYDLESIADIINENKDYFKKYADAVINNDKLGDYKGQVLELFKIVVAKKDYLDLDNIVNNLKKLSITYYKVKPEGMTSYAVGEYYNSDLSIKLIDKSSRVAYHELLHFIQFNKDRKYDDRSHYIYNCNDKYMAFQDVIKLEPEAMETCKFKTVYSSSVEESSAEENTTEYFIKGVPEVYLKETQVYELMEYIFGTDYMDEVSFSYNRFYKLFSGFNKYLNWDPERFEEFLNNYEEINSIDVSYDASEEQAYALYKVVDDLIDLYEAKTKTDWQDNIFMTTSIRYILYIYLNHDTVYDDLQSYLEDNDVTIKHLDELDLEDLQYKESVEEEYNIYSSRIIIGNTNSSIKTDNAIVYNGYRKSDYEGGYYFEYYNGDEYVSSEFKPY